MSAATTGQLDQAKAKFFNERTRKAQTQRQQAEVVLESLKIDLAREEEKRERELAADSHHHVYVFDSDVNTGSVKKCVTQLQEWARRDPGCAIEIQINSPGGIINEGFALIDFIRDLREKNHEITMVTYGMAASMAGVILQAADKRVMGENAFLLIHQGSLGAIGDFGEVKDRVKLMEQYHERILALFESRAKPINEKTTARWIKNRWERTDWWIPAEEALKLGFVDEIR